MVDDPMNPGQLVYFAEDGNWGNAERMITIFDKDLTEQEWEILAELPDSERYAFVRDLVKAKCDPYDDIF